MRGIYAEYEGYNKERRRKAEEYMKNYDNSGAGAPGKAEGETRGPSEKKWKK